MKDIVARVIFETDVPVIETFWEEKMVLQVKIAYPSLNIDEDLFLNGHSVLKNKLFSQDA